MRRKKSKGWTVRSLSATGDDGSEKRTCAVQLLYGSDVVHTLTGPTALKTLQTAAEQFTATGYTPEPYPPIKTRADGWRQSSKSHKV
jgi:hypothetical protein